MDTTYRKIELQSPADLKYLVANASRAARQKIDLHFPLAQHRRYIHNTFKGVKDSISINGLEATEMEAQLGGQGQSGEEIEPYDTRLAQRIRDLSATVERTTLQLAQLRRSAPTQASQEYQQSFARDSDAFDASLKVAEEAQIEAMKREADDMQVGGLERSETMRGMWERGTEGLVGLKKDMGTTVARAERARDVVGYLDG
ncbi:hypothetical protein H2203_004009 [Taxawa tesnikishii (nom. ined.)]|nr:hypothetical protein H2203_004009 [Dothideales sp. JES 119]